MQRTVRRPCGRSVLLWALPATGEPSTRIYKLMARNDFHGPEPKALSPWESYAQALMLTNEYYYVD